MLVRSQSNTASAFAESSNDPNETTYNSGFLATLVAIATLGGFLFGYDTSIIAGA